MNPYDPKAPTPSQKGALVGLSLSMLMASLDTSIANSGLPTLARSFEASFQHVQWIVLAYLLAITALIVSVGRLGDLIGRRRLLLFGISLFTMSSVVCGLAPSLWVLVAARAAQGLGAAVMMALTIAFVGETVPKERLGSSMGLLGTMSAIGTALGPSLGGLLIAGIGWRAIFLVNLPLGIVALTLVYRYLPRPNPSANAQGATFDTHGTILLAAALAAYSLAMTVGNGHFGSLNFMLMAASAAGLLLFGIAETKSRSPLIDLAIFRDRMLTGSLVTSLLVSTVIMATLVVGPFYLSQALALDSTRVGLLLSVGPLVVVLAGIPAGRFADRIGTSRVALIGLCAMGVGSLSLSLAPRQLGIVGYLVPIVILTGGYALFQTSNNTAIMTGVSPDRRGLLSGALSLSRNLGLITGASVMGAVFAFAAGASEVATAPPLAVALGMKVTFAVAAGLIGIAFGVALMTSRHGILRVVASAFPATDGPRPQ